MRRDPRLNAVASLKLQYLRRSRMPLSSRDPRLNAVASLKRREGNVMLGQALIGDPRLNAVASLKHGEGRSGTDELQRDPRLNAVASLKLVHPIEHARQHQVIHGLMPWPH